MKHSTAFSIRLSFTFLGSIFPFLILLGQSNIAIIDYEKIKINIIEKGLVDSGEDTLATKLNKHFSLYVDRFQSEVKRFEMEHYENPIVSQHEVNKIMYKEIKLIAIQEDIDSLINDYRTKGEAFIKTLIHHSIQTLAIQKNVNFDLVLNTKDLVYYDSKLDLTDLVLKNLNLHRSQKLAKVSIENYISKIINQNFSHFKTLNYPNKIPQNINLKEFLERSRNQ